MCFNFACSFSALAVLHAASASGIPSPESLATAFLNDAGHPLANDAFRAATKGLDGYTYPPGRLEALANWHSMQLCARPMRAPQGTKLADAVEQRAQEMNPSWASHEDSRVLWILQEYCRLKDTTEDEVIAELAKYSTGMTSAFDVSPITGTVAVDELLKYCRDKPIAMIVLKLGKKNPQMTQSWHGRTIVARSLIDAKQFADLDKWNKLTYLNAITPALLKRYANNDMTFGANLIKASFLNTIRQAYVLTPEKGRCLALEMMLVYGNVINFEHQRELPARNTAFDLKLLDRDLEEADYYPTLIATMLSAPSIDDMHRQYNFLLDLEHDGNTDIAASAHVALILASREGLKPIDSLICALALMDKNITISKFNQLGCMSSIDAYPSMALACFESHLVRSMNVHPDTRITLLNHENKLVTFTASALITTSMTYDYIRGQPRKYTHFFYSECGMQRYIEGVSRAREALQGLNFNSDLGLAVTTYRDYANHFAIQHSFAPYDDLFMTSLLTNRDHVWQDILRTFFDTYEHYAFMSMRVHSTVAALRASSPSLMALIYHAARSLGRLQYPQDDIDTLKPILAYFTNALYDKSVHLNWIRSMRVCLEITKRTIPELAPFISDAKPERCTESYQDIQSIANKYLQINIFQDYKGKLSYVYIEQSPQALL